MWLVMYQPDSNCNPIPQLLFQTENEAQRFLLSTALNVTGIYYYCFVPINTPNQYMIYSPRQYR